MSGDVTYQALERLTYLPDREALKNGNAIAGQSHYDVYFTGGTIRGVTISNLASPLQINSGGTGQITANAALNALLPSQTGNAGKALKTDGTNTSWSTDTDTGITQLTGDVTAGPGSGSQVATVVNAPASGITGTTLAANVVTSSLTSFGNSPILVSPALGTPASGVLTNCTGLPLTTGATGILSGANGGTGVNNSGKTITLGGNFTTSGAFSAILTLLGATNVTLPTTGTLATLAGAETLTNKTLTNPIFTNGIAHVGSFSRNLSTASGTQAITGVGFQPKSVIFIMGLSGGATISWGMDSITTKRAFYGIGAGNFAQTGGASIVQYTNVSEEQDGAISSFDADGFTITWTKVGSPASVTANGIFIAFP